MSVSARFPSEPHSSCSSYLPETNLNVFCFLQSDSPWLIPGVINCSFLLSFSHNKPKHLIQESKEKQNHQQLMQQRLSIYMKFWFH